MLVRPGVARQPLPTLRRLLPSTPFCTPSRCPAPSAPRSLAASHRVLTTVADSHPRRRRTFRALVGFERTLATALEPSGFASETIPFEGLPPNLMPGYRPERPPEPPIYALRPLDVNSPLIPIDEAPYPQRQRISIHGIPGDLDEMLSVFEACVQVGRLERASMVLKRFAVMNNLDPRRLLDLHIRYLQGRVAELAAEPDLDKADQLIRWFDKYIHKAGLPYTPLTIAYMLKTTLLAGEASSRARRIQRFMGMMPHQPNVPLDLGNVLNDDDLAAIAELCPNYYVAEDPELAMDLDTTAEEDEDATLFGTTDSPSQSSPKAPAAMPQVLATPQKGMGLKMLKSTLSLFNGLPEGLNVASLTPEQRQELQSKLEKDCVDSALDKWRESNEALTSIGLNPQVSSPSLSSKLYEWHQALTTRLTWEQQQVEAAEATLKKSKEELDRCLYGPHLLRSDASRLAAVTILATLNILAMNGADKGAPVSSTVQQLGRFAEQDIRAQAALTAQATQAAAEATRKQRTARQLMRLYGAFPTPPKPAAKGRGKAKAKAAATAQAPFEARWPLATRAQVGAVLLGALVDSAKIVVERQLPDSKKIVSQVQPAFSHAVQLKKGKKVGVIQPNRALIELMKREPRGEALARHLPMLVEPTPWTEFEVGGFIESPNAIIRLKNHEKDQRLYAEAAIERGDMEQMMRGLDVLGKTAWRINRPVFEVMLQAWNTGGELANIPALNPDIPIPAEPDSTDDPMMRRLWLRAVKAAENEKTGLHSVRCFMNFQLEIARAFKDQTFYFPHNLDFRGRAYPLPTYLNHMGADHTRGLLLFAEGKPLGEAGLRWLKVHLSNVFGFDKASLKDREQFADAHMEEIRDSTDNPLTGKRWWLEAEDPWQCLATCYELKAALSCADPTTYVSHLPVHQDGTCNGLQHYAALGGDTWGAQQVNLLPGERPADVYSAVAQLVQELVTKDMAAGNDFARAVDGKIVRKVVKQPVMTNVYGVTYIGAKKQVLKQLDALYPDLFKETGITSAVLASYIAAKIFVALSTMFRGAHDIQTWLGEIGGRVCRSLTPEQLDVIAEQFNGGDSVGKKTAKKTAKKTTNKTAKEADETTPKARKTLEDDMAAQFRSTLVWTTPLRMPVVQPYRMSGSRIVKTCMQELVLISADRDDPVNRRKQLQAFPPNFIHSLDASHMMLSALECSTLGLTFAAVHDSFWTHAADVDSMNGVLREAFIRIHGEDVIGRLKAEFEARYRGAIYHARIPANTPAAQAISAHRRSNRIGPDAEVLQERRRQMLLQSSDPEEVRQGREMITPASIFEQLATPAEIMNEVDPEDLKMAEPLEEDEEGSELEAAAEEGETVGRADKEVESMEKFGAGLKHLYGTNYFEIETNKAARRTRTAKAMATTKVIGQVAFWTPLVFPPIPKKGDFDVSSLRKSQYFFS
ncbi:hypothetical protein C8A05DRAFT_17171 [Staphylotrichum tortipilum]|uniref:DNA-directed RNA polymerase n=1 Tax=Staphylotrichum tortipilum TaxID=2831512 RepID=A0AAN6MII3_9PEZI|nr:hypothetical protein C8A05DRAFT_17171 [Staphylotrichum longicolle]